MILGLTGGIGSGKSTVARLLEILGCAVFNSDEEAKAAYLDEGIPAQVSALIGKEAYDENGRIDREFIAKRVFSDETLLTRLNAIIHPAVGRRFGNFVSAHPGSIVVKESALLFEAGIASACDRVAVVAAADEERIMRVMKRDNIGREAVLARMARQLPQEEKIRRADHVIWNDGDRMVIPQVLDLYRELAGAQLK